MSRLRIAGSSARVLVVGIAVGAVVSACTIGTDKDTAKAPSSVVSAPATTPVQLQPAAPGTPAPAADVTVEVKDMKFAPASATVRAGQTVTWKFDDGGIPHQIAGLDDAGMAINSRILNEGAYSYTFDKPGTYKYICSLHPEMKGTITVTP